MSWVLQWFCHPHSQMNISKIDEHGETVSLWVWTWQNLKVQAKIEIIRTCSIKVLQRRFKVLKWFDLCPDNLFSEEKSRAFQVRREWKNDGCQGAIAGQMSGVFRTRKSLFFVQNVLFWKSVVQGSPQNHGWQLCRMPDVFAKALEPRLVLHRSKVADDSSCFTQKGIAECFVRQKDWVLSIRNWSNHIWNQKLFLALVFLTDLSGQYKHSVWEKDMHEVQYESSQPSAPQCHRGTA